MTAAADGLRGRHLHFDTPSGAAGDMVMGALLDAGVPEAVVREALRRLDAVIGAEYELVVRKGKRGGIVGTDVRAEVKGGGGGGHGHAHAHGHAHGHAHAHDHAHEHAHEHGGARAHAHAHGEHAHRHYLEIRQMLRLLPDRVAALAEDIFERIAVAEAKLHGTSVDEVAFHEVGAIDSIVDVVGAAAALAWLAPASVSATPVPLGHGRVRAAHGVLPVPAPATLEIARAADMPVEDGGVAMELSTPTGAAILAAIVRRWGPMPALRVAAIGYGAGDRELADRPNLLRAVIGEPVPARAAADGELVQLEANLDDMSPELCGYVTERLFAAGALDVWWTPATMKKSRPATILGVLAPAALLDALAGVVFAETTTIGLRTTPVARRVLDRESVTVTTPYGPVVVKVARQGDAVLNAAPEYESCRVLAAEKGIPLKEIYAAALAAFRAR